ncbi:MAG TPA: universal stress protein [Phenylobacterium sp.]|nr:universal stress protein [Phenylobacterium sp.]
MPLPDILLQIDSYPDPTSPEAIAQAVGFVAAVGGTVTGLAVQVDIQAPANRLADYLIHLSRMAKDEEQKSLEACRSALEVFSAKAREAGVMGEALVGKADLYDVGDYVARRARTRDLCIVPMVDRLDGQRSIAEDVVFGSGRPTLLFRPDVAALPGGGLGVVVLAWDGSRSAARAMAGALPILQAAREVRVLTVINEKAEAHAGQGADAARHLEAHGVKAAVDEVDAAGRRIGQVLEDHVAKCGADLLVMGAYGRSRVREFILGGATEHMLHDPKVALLLAN